MSTADATTFADGGMVIDSQAFITAWQQQHAKLTTPMHAAFTPPALAPLSSPQALAHVATLKSHALFTKIYGAVAQIEMIELGRLIASQWWVDTHVSGGLHGAGVQASPTEADILNKCLPPDIVPPVQAVQWGAAPNGVVVYSTNNTLGVVGPNVNPLTGQITYAVGPGANLMLVREFAGRYVLVNGYHRAWLLRSRGVSMVPAVITHVAAQKDVAPEPGFIPEPILFGARPPTIDDFFDNTLSSDIEVRAILKAVKITAEVSIVPRLLY
ncbi:MAG TPA: hypothetical protein VGH20_19135 [Myxococcales bacterium]|jgi:hypothetical protein